MGRTRNQNRTRKKGDERRRTFLGGFFKMNVVSLCLKSMLPW